VSIDLLEARMALVRIVLQPYLYFSLGSFRLYYFSKKQRIWLCKYITRKDLLFPWIW